MCAHTCICMNSGYNQRQRVIQKHMGGSVKKQFENNGGGGAGRIHFKQRWVPKTIEHLHSVESAYYGSV